MNEASNYIMDQFIEEAKTSEIEQNTLTEVEQFLIDDIILEFCFEAHRSIKLNYFDLFILSNYDDSMGKMKNLEKPSYVKLPIGRKRPVYEMNGSATTECKTFSDIISITEIMQCIEGTVKNCNKCKRIARGYDYVSFYERVEEYRNEMTSITFGISPAEIKSAEVPETRSEGRFFYPEWYFNIKEFSTGNGSVLLSQNDAYVKTSTILNKHMKPFDMSDKSITCNSRIDEDAIIHSAIKNILETAENLTDSMIIEFLCLDCTNFKPFQSWLKFILSKHLENETGNGKIKAAVNKIDRKSLPYPENKFNPDMDIFGRYLKELEKQIYKSTCVCMICKRKVGVSRFAAHLSNCIGIGRVKSRRLRTRKLN